MFVLNGSTFPILKGSELDYDALSAELRKLRENVAGVTDTVIAASDGIPIVADVAKNIDPAHISALAAADLGIARQAAEVIGLGTLSQTVVFGTEGYMAVYAIGRLSLMVVLGDKGLNLGRLLHETRPVIERVGVILSS
ncbi:roadblock/LC7 domain-containing protein [Lentzea sp. BCCO 10_0798]|uniref:Roadblock/LC7 domain-containing protein n=1 Tax=Lentzea kristufekii TaxID=3095430 RepID=A0ABU4TLT4_9PSEU|nr:roadblock/LC7 domain-containing protein [Lentzea sp. BCCO 10_0798]